jgi:murein DD-endopeptidase MepM/ murein hydrolase activator NlpD
VVLLAGLGGFALGAATVLLVVWAYGVHGAAGPGAWGPGGAGAAAPGAAGGAAAPRPGRGRPGGAVPGGPSGMPPAGTPGTPGWAPGLPGVPPEAGGPPPSPPAVPPSQAGDVDALRGRHLLLPVQGLRREELHDNFSEARAGHLHEALDIMAARNTPVLAVEDGRLTKLFASRQGGNTIYQLDPSGTYTYYYAHLERYADGLQEGAQLRRGQVIGYVGTSGNAPPGSPHLHFAIFRMTPEKQWWKGTAIDPFLVLAQP